MLRAKKTLFAAAILMSGQGFADTVVSGGANGLNFSTDVQNIYQIALSGENFNATFDALSFYPSTPLEDGFYHFEISGVTGVKAVDDVDNGRDGSTQEVDITTVVDTGSFTISGGNVLDMSAKEGEQ